MSILPTGLPSLASTGGNKTGYHDYLPGIDVGAALGLLTGKDGDVLSGVSVRGGERTTNNGGFIGGTNTGGASSSWAPAPAPAQNMLAGSGPLQGDALAAYNQQQQVAQQQAAQARAAQEQASWYDDQANNLNGQIGRLDGQQATGLGNIDSSYNTQYNRLGEQKAMGERNYNTSRDQTIQGYTNTRNGVMSQTNAHMSALQRLLGMNGAGNSSAAYDAVPYAATMVGSQALGQAQQTYGNNLGALDTNWQDTQRQYSNSLSDLGDQKFQQQQGLKSSIASTRAGLLEKIAEATRQRELAKGGGYEQAKAAANPYMEQVNSLLSQMTQLGNQYQNPVMQAKDVHYAAPNLGQYSLGQGMSGPQNPSLQTPEGSGANPLLTGLLGQKERDQYGNPL
jgi:hypothetical protein